MLVFASNTNKAFVSNTQIDYFQCREESVLECQVLVWPSRAVVFYERIATDAKYVIIEVIVAGVERPIEVRPTELVVDYGLVSNEERTPKWFP